MTFYSAFVCWLIFNELLVLAILPVNVSISDIDDRRDPTHHHHRPIAFGQLPVTESVVLPPLVETTKA
jgi:hypothetical protein